MILETGLIKTFGGFFLNAAVNLLTGAASNKQKGGTSVIAELVTSVTGNLLSNHVATLSNVAYGNIALLLEKNDPAKVNHDLERLFRSASVVSIKYVKELFIQNIHAVKGYNNLNEDELNNFHDGIKFFFDQSIQDLQFSVESEPYALLDKGTIKNPEKYLDDIIEQIFTFSSVKFDENTLSGLKKFYKTHLPYCFELAFKEAIKHDEVGFRAFQIWTLEETEKQNAEQKNVLKKIEIAIEKLKSGSDFLPKTELDRICDDVTNRIYTILDEKFNKISAKLDQLSRNISEDFRSLQDKVERIGETTDDIKNLANELVQKADILIEYAKNEIDKEPNIDKNLTVGPIKPQLLIGREPDIAVVRRKLVGGSSPVFVSGDGGLGKSSFCSGYYHSYRAEYKYAAWIFNRESILSSILSLSSPLHLEFGDAESIEVRVQEVIRSLTSLEGPNLLIIDNANNENDINNNLSLLRRLYNFHILVTSRVKVIERASTFVLNALSEANALELFKSHYLRHAASDDQAFYAIYNAVGRNTLVVELLAKHLNVSNRFKITYSVQDLVADLQKGLLSIRKDTIVSGIDYLENNNLDDASPQEIIMAMYEISKLDESRLSILSLMSLLPSESIKYDSLAIILKHISDLDQSLHSLYESGWIDFDHASSVFRMSPVVQEIIRHKNTALLDAVLPSIDCMIDDFSEGHSMEVELLLSYSESTMYQLAVLKIVPVTEAGIVSFARMFYCLATGNELKNQLYAGSFWIDTSISFYKRVLSEHRLDEFAAKLRKDELSTGEYKLVQELLDSYYLAADINRQLHYANKCIRYKDSIAQISELFNTNIDLYRLGRYLAVGGRLPEAERIFFTEFLKQKKIFSSLKKLNTDSDFVAYYSEDARVKNSDIGEMRMLADHDLVVSGQMIAVCTLDLARIYRQLKRYNEAVVNHRISIEYIRYFADSPQFEGFRSIGIMEWIKVVLDSRIDISLPDNLFSKCINGLESSYGSNSLRVGEFWSVWLSWTLRKGIFADAYEKMYVMAKRKIISNDGIDSPILARMNLTIAEHLKEDGTLDHFSDSTKKEIFDSIFKVIYDNFSESIDRFGISNDVLLRGISVVADLCLQKGDEDKADILLKRGRELLRILNTRARIRVNDLISEAIDDQELVKLISGLRRLTSLPQSSSDIEVKLFGLPFFRSYRLCHVTFPGLDITCDKYFLVSNTNLISLRNGVAAAFKLVSGDLILSVEDVLPYIIIYYDSHFGSQGRYYLLPTIDEMPWQVDVVIEQKYRDLLDDHFMPPDVSVKEEHYVCSINVLFFRCLFRVNIYIDKKTGQIVMQESEQKVLAKERESGKVFYKDVNGDAVEIRFPAHVEPIYGSSMWHKYN